jgi:gamma-glutamylcyclotransferase (GGCT)/AIG2-like uncharacterized protein YtfP
LVEAFFFYGTLITGGGSPRVAAALSRLCPRGGAVAQGLLYALDDPDGCYPAMVAGQGAVYGRLMALSPEFIPEDLAALDAYEDADYHRLAIEVRRQDGAVVQAWAYVWAGPVPEEAVPLPDGDFAAFLKATGRSAYRDPA